MKLILITFVTVGLISCGGEKNFGGGNFGIKKEPEKEEASSNSSAANQDEAIIVASADEVPSSDATTENDEILQIERPDSIPEMEVEEGSIEEGEPKPVVAVIKDLKDLDVQERTALDECAKKWGAASPFSSEQLNSPNVVTLNSTLSNNANLYSNLEKTPAATLYLINLDTKNANQGSITLTNTNGWYCLNVLAKVINNFEISTSCKEQLAIISQKAQNDNNFTISDAAPCT